MPQPITHAVWTELAEHARELERVPLRDLFATDPDRLERMTLRLADLRVDLSKSRARPDTLERLFALADAQSLRSRIDAMFSGDKINVTERRAVLHIALRNRSTRSIEVDGRDVMPDVRRVLDQISAFTAALRSGSHRGATGERITDVVNVGIGGSDLGPAMVCDALAPYWLEARDRIRPHFVSNVDPAHLVRTLSELRPQTTLFVVASKTFTTQETLANARAARAWLVAALGEAAVASHFVAVSTNHAEVAKFGIARERTFELWDWVGGRYSLWSAIGLPIAIAVGYERFTELLEGAHAMDEHFRSAPWAENIPVVLGLLGLWYANFLGAETFCLLPYAQSLARLPAWLQQGDMESNGKSIDLEGRRIDRYTTGPIVWGEPGTNGQHAFFQLLHQGTRKVPVEILYALRSEWDTTEVAGLAPLLAAQHSMLVANAIAQAEAFMVGKDRAIVERELSASGMPPERIAELAPHRVFDGDRPSTTITFEHLDPRTLGMLLAMYEHRIFVQGAIWNINSFDQWGVELGKQLATTILGELHGGAPAPHDASTRAQIDAALASTTK